MCGPVQPNLLCEHEYFYDSFNSLQNIEYDNNLICKVNYLLNWQALTTVAQWPQCAAELEVAAATFRHAKPLMYHALSTCCKNLRLSKLIQTPPVQRPHNRIVVLERKTPDLARKPKMQCPPDVPYI